MIKRVLHGTAWFLPESIGGTEVYIASLASALGQFGVDCAVAVFRPDGIERSFRYGGIEVREFVVPPASGRFVAEHARVWCGPSTASFRQWAGTFDVYHQHALTSACGLVVLDTARTVGCATVFTHHVPDVHCLSGTMVLDGAGVCDGRIDETACARCWAIHRGLAPLAAGAVASPLAAPVGRLIGRVLPKRLSTALSARELVAGKRQQLVELAAAADQVVAVCEWLRAALVANGMPGECLNLVRQGLAMNTPSPGRIDCGRHHGTVRVAYLGRCTEVKGIDVAVSALRALDDQPGVTLDLHFTEPSGGPDAAYAARLRRLAEGDARIRFAGPLPPSEVAHALRAFDIVVVPSRWLETGPLIVLEALSAGAVVVGSDRGGIAELARIYPGVRLAPPDDVDAWTLALRDAIDTVRRCRVRPSVPVRTMDEVAANMLPVYEAAMARARTITLLAGALT